MPRMNRTERPLGVVLIAKDDTPERILFKYPYVFDVPTVPTPDSDSQRDADPNVPPVTPVGPDALGDVTDKTVLADIGNKRETTVDSKEPKADDKVPCFPVKLLAAILQPKEEVCGVPFEIKVDNVRYAGVPWQANRAGQCISIIFVLPGTCSQRTVDAFQSLSRKLVVAIFNEQQRCGFLKEQIQIIQPLLDKADSCEDDSYVPFHDIEIRSKLAKSLRDVYEEICEYGIVDVFINDCIQVGFCVELRSLSGALITPNPTGDVDVIMNALKPYHTILFFEDCVPSPDCNPFVLKFFEYYDIEKSIEEVCFLSKMPLRQMKDVVRHYLLWARAKVIFPVCASNLYSTAQSEIVPSHTHNTFQEQFPEVSLAKILAHFHPPCTLGDFLEETTMFTELKIRKQMLIFMLRNGFLTQLHTYLYLLPPSSQEPRFLRPIPEAELVLLSNRVKTQLRQFKDGSLRDALARISVDAQRAGLPEPDFFWLLSTFLSLQPFFNGKFHVEAIMYYKRMDRTTLTRVFDMFSDLLVPFLCIDNVVDETERCE